ncbi:hypothetical protein BT63DRAFT_460141 [Microthyrium microscopicum]|uniref:Uncharacterized protein n=1 Tax=Microthyrium microscopicum TaxID=703497 RepID=A0A6A6TY66_9PEZI|nr:hypothetical protein BT63DRAFT_460141 [Microthyrium microscopicum]
MCFFRFRDSAPPSMGAPPTPPRDQSVKKRTYSSFVAGDLVVGRHDPKAERDSPRRPTPVVFPDPAHIPEFEPVTWTNENKPNFYDLRMKWNHPAGIRSLEPKIFEELNITLEPACDVPDFLHSNDALKLCMPPLQWAMTAPTAEQRKEVCDPILSRPIPGGPVRQRKLPNGRGWPTRGDFWDRLQQLNYPNVDGFRAFARIPNAAGDPPPRLTHARPFYEHLDSMVQYWDTSLDEYLKPTTPPPEAKTDEEKEAGQKADGNAEHKDGDGGNENEPRKRTKLSPKRLSKAEYDPAASNVIIPSQGLPISAKPQNIAPSTRRQQARAPDTPAGKYRGWRIDCGARMPNNTRDHITKAILEVALWPFGYQVDAIDRAPARLALQNCRIPVPISRQVWRPSTDRLEARGGIVYGPAMATSVRAVTCFDQRVGAEEVDLLREVGALLCLAQERYRQGRTEVIAGEGKWWYKKPRFGGLPYQVPGEYVFLPADPRGYQIHDSSVEEAQVSANVIQERRVLGYTARKEKEKARHREELPGDMNAKQRAIYSYKKFSPASPTWDAKVKYTAIGKEKESDWDDVFLVSALNHHISILKLHVHKAYVHFVETGEMPTSTVPADWCQPIVQRTQWLDLIKPEERSKAFYALWSIGGYLTRPGAIV